MTYPTAAAYQQLNLTYTSVYLHKVAASVRPIPTAYLIIYAILSHLNTYTPFTINTYPTPTSIFYATPYPQPFCRYILLPH